MKNLDPVLNISLAQTDVIVLTVVIGIIVPYVITAPRRY